ncbi:eCIS core domain-containing protein [Mucilaginibacter lappiensis]|uniref:eCIS core domain-containing protein n=1 Tax=Mucilaginibacter lappiensis TaxID=354630 RepID=A0A841JAN6_9SPHI|nr:DUF4157 domain-containing protein [Mucilaginibacter lappiensis]MBB6127734.1 hypothetical protein [Mucilaginibacter lappiensis]
MLATKQSQAENTVKAQNNKPFFPSLLVQPKLQVNEPGDRYEQEADAMADQVMRMSISSSNESSFFKPAPPVIQRKCQHCEEEEKLHRKESTTAETSGSHELDNYIGSLGSSGQALPESSRQFFEPRFGHDFSNVRIHTGSVAAKSAQSINALAYTTGNNIVFNSGQYSTESDSGKRLMAHELTHVVQQGGSIENPSNLSLKRNTQNNSSEPLKTLTNSSAMVSRADTQAVGVTMNLGHSARTGVEFWPTNLVDTHVGPVTVQGGLLGSSANQLSAIIGENINLHTLAVQLLPLWITATPFTPPGAAAPLPLDIITVDELAKGLMVYNQYYFPVQTMANWRSGFRLPLPILIDAATGIGTLHPLQIRQLATAFDPAWLPLLNQRASGITAPAAATVQADVTAFLAQETTSMTRGIHLGARSLTNAVAELPFVRETFHQLGVASFDVALEFMNSLVNPQIAILESQMDGASILNEIMMALSHAPAAITPAQQASLDRANIMFGNIVAVAPVTAPTAARSRPEKTVTIDTVKLDGSNRTPATDVASANAILAQCNVRLVYGVDAVATNAETMAWMGGNTDLHVSPNCGPRSVEERSMYNGATARFGLGSRIRAFYPATMSGSGAAGYSLPPFCATGLGTPFLNMIVLTNLTTAEDLAHEVGHILTNSGAHPAATVMSATNARTVLTLGDAQCTNIYNNA